MYHIRAGDQNLLLRGEDWPDSTMSETHVFFSGSVWSAPRLSFNVLWISCADAPQVLRVIDCAMSFCIFYPWCPSQKLLRTTLFVSSQYENFIDAQSRTSSESTRTKYQNVTTANKFRDGIIIALMLFFSRSVCWMLNRWLGATTTNVPPSSVRMAKSSCRAAVARSWSTVARSIRRKTGLRTNLCVVWSSIAGRWELYRRR